MSSTLPEIPDELRARHAEVNKQLGNLHHNGDGTKAEYWEQLIPVYRELAEIYGQLAKILWADDLLMWAAEHAKNGAIESARDAKRGARDMRRLDAERSGGDQQ